MTESLLLICIYIILFDFTIAYYESTVVKEWLHLHSLAVTTSNHNIVVALSQNEFVTPDLIAVH